MLELLHIENIAVIEEADIRFLPGFNALTGETGAGKSIVIDAMGAVLGGRTSRELIRTGADKAFVSAEFSAVPADLPGLSAAGVAPDEEGTLLLQREISADGKNACRANGRPITVSQLRQIGADLLNIHGQHDGAALLDEEQHQTYLDRFGRTEEVLAAYRETYDALAELLGRIRALKMDEAEKARRMDSLRFQIGELERAELVPGEEEELLARRTLLRSGEKYIAALDGADYSLSGGEDSGGALSAIRDAEEAISGVRTLSDDLGELYKRLEALRCEAYDLAEIVRDKRAEFDFSPAELDAVESRADHRGGHAGLSGQVPGGAGRHRDRRRHPGPAGKKAGEGPAGRGGRRRGADRGPEGGRPRSGAAHPGGAAGSGYAQGPLCHRFRGERARP